MSSIEGMWQFQTGSVDEPQRLLWGGIVVLETGRAFGGDSVMAYTGSYTADQKGLRAEVRSWTWNVDVEGANVFGMPMPADYEVVLEGARSGDEIIGSVYPKGAPDMRLPIRMTKITDLP